MAKFVYFGSSHFSKTVLETLIERGARPTLVVTKPDTPRGRGLRVLPTQISQCAAHNDCPTFKPHFLHAADTAETLRTQEADYFVVADYGKIIPRELLFIPKKFPLCIHPSLLPRYRGPAPIEYALRNGDTATGVTIFIVNERVDAGDVLLQESYPISPEDTFITLRRKLAQRGAQALLRAFEMIAQSRHQRLPQDERAMTMTAKLTKADGLIDWATPASSIINQIRATCGWPSTYTYYRNLRIHILNAKAQTGGETLAPGTIAYLKKEGMGVRSGDGIVCIHRLKPEGKKEMTAWAFVCGHRLKIGECFGVKSDTSEVHENVIHVFFSGTVQGVGFRLAAKRYATLNDLRGEVKNCADGRVEIIACGRGGDIDRFIATLRDRFRTHIHSVAHTVSVPLRKYNSFEISH